jgi:hypothetical protein
MNQEYFTKFSEMAKKAQEPLQAIAELNVKTLQGMAYLKPDEITHIKKPQDFFEMQLSLALSNGHKAMEYMQKSFDIIEKAMLTCAKTCAEETKKADVKK